VGYFFFLGGFSWVPTDLDIHMGRSGYVIELGACLVLFYNLRVIKV